MFIQPAFMGVTCGICFPVTVNAYTRLGTLLSDLPTMYHVPPTDTWSALSPRLTIWWSCLPADMLILWGVSKQVLSMLLGFWHQFVSQTRELCWGVPLENFQVYMGVMCQHWQPQLLKEQWNILMFLLVKNGDFQCYRNFLVQKLRSLVS